MPQRAFTLIELLVVVSIIAVLAALLMPTITLIRDSARKTVCKGHMRQGGMAYLLYTGENEGFLPNTGSAANANIADTAKLDPYLPNTEKVWVCREVLRRAPSNTQGRFYWNWRLNWNQYSTWNGSPSNGGASNSGLAVRLDSIPYKGYAMLFADLDDAARGGYHRDRTNLLTADLVVNDRGDTSLRIPYAQVVSYADPGPTICAEYICTSPAKRLKGLTP